MADEKPEFGPDLEGARRLLDANLVKLAVAKGILVGAKITSKDTVELFIIERLQVLLDEQEKFNRMIQSLIS